MALCHLQFIRKLSTLRTSQESGQLPLLRKKLRRAFKKPVIPSDHISIFHHRSTKTKQKSAISSNPSALLLFRLIKVLCWLSTKKHPKTKQAKIKNTKKPHPQRRTNFESYEHNLSCTKPACYQESAANIFFQFRILICL